MTGKEDKTWGRHVIAVRIVVTLSLFLEPNRDVISSLDYCTCIVLSHKGDIGTVHKYHYEDGYPTCTSTCFAVIGY